MPALTHNRVRNGFNGGRKLLNATAGVKFRRTVGATTADVIRSKALVGGIGSHSRFVRRAIKNRAVISKKSKKCCTNITKNISGTITITGTAKVGNILTSNITDTNGVPSNVTYQWYRNSVLITGANNKTYTLVTADQTNIITVNAIYTDNMNYTENITSTATSAVA
tara:strand:+ start:472 stop:972 length:501 start_codon:yes stop_codon:yes gene_type:complete